MALARPKFSNLNAAELVTDINNRWSDDFGGVGLDLSKWDVELAAAGMSYSVSASSLTVLMGTTINDELRLLSEDVFTVPFDFTAILSMSQRIANNAVYIEAVEVDADGNPITNDNLLGDWRNRASILLDGTVATTGKLETVAENSGAALSQSGTITTTASPVDLTVEVRAKDVQLNTATADSSTARSASVILNSSSVPDPNKLYKLRLRFKNGASAPATSTSVVLRRVYTQDANELTVEVTSARGDQSGGRAMAVNVANTPSVAISGNPVLGVGANLVGDVGVQIVASRGTAVSIARLISAAATTNATSVKAAAGKVAKVIAFNAAASVRFLKLYNKASAPAVGTDTPTVTIALEPGKLTQFDVDAIGVSFGTGIAYALTTGVADSDTAALTAGDVAGLHILYV